MATDQFLKACGSNGPLVLEISRAGSADVERRVLEQPYVLLGRDPRADVTLDDEMVSRRHAYLQLIAGRLFWVDLESRTGTGVGGQAVESGWLGAGESLTVGPYLIRLGGEPSEEEPPALASPLSAVSDEASGLPRVALEFQGKTSEHPAWMMGQVLALVGTGIRCRVRLRDRGVSKLHCALVRTTEGLWTVDLMGRGGITVNGEAVRASRLVQGDLVGLGGVLIRVDLEGKGSEIAALAAGPLTNARGPGMAGMFPVSKGPGYAELPVVGGDPSLAMLLNHFGQMQQQMLDQFQQSMLMMMQMFGGMHREQMGLVRDELEQLRSLNNEIANIKVEMAKGPRAAVPPGHTAPWPPLAANGKVSAPKPAPAPKPAVASPKDARSATPGAKSTLPPVAPPLEPPNPAVHEWLNERLATITEEQQTRWQRIMDLLAGNRGGGK